MAHKIIQLTRCAPDGPFLKDNDGGPGQQLAIDGELDVGRQAGHVLPDLRVRDRVHQNVFRGIGGQLTPYFFYNLNKHKKW